MHAPRQTAPAARLRRAAPPPPKPVLLILHQEHSTPGRMGWTLEQRGFSLDIRRPRFGDPLPKTMAEHAGAVIFGGPMSANDPDDFVKAETDWIGTVLAEDAPFLGICLGAQMMSRQLGGRVSAHAEGMAEIGYYPLYPTEAGKTLMAWPGHAYQWHREGFTVPPGCELLATGDMFEAQAFRFGKNAYGIQFHPEVTHAMMCRWLVRGAARLELPGAQCRLTQHEGRAVHDGAVRQWLNDFLDLWLGPAPVQPRARRRKLRGFSQIATHQP